MTNMEAYDNLMARMKDLFLLRSATSIINWDMETYMPPKGIMLRSEQLSQLYKMMHRIVTDSEIEGLLKKLPKHRSD